MAMFENLLKCEWNRQVTFYDKWSENGLEMVKSVKMSENVKIMSEKYLNNIMLLLNASLKNILHFNNVSKGYEKVLKLSPLKSV